ncbi:MAG: DUF3047 domain-containing protein [Parachlamydiales bacterium]
MRSTLSAKLLSVVVFPLSFNQWTPIKVNSHDLPKISSENQEWRIVTNNSAGGYASLFKEAIPLGKFKLAWEWRVLKYPKVNTVLPFKKENDDSALRVGLLISGDSENISIPRPLKKTLDEKNYKLTNILFYSSENVPDEKCGISPYQKGILYCLKHSESQWKTVDTNPMTDLVKGYGISPDQAQKLKVIGLWIFADSDNSESDSESFIRKIQIEFLGESK